MTFGLSDATIEKIRSVFARHPQVEKAVLYGSRAKGTFRNGSDIDLTLFGDGLTYELLSLISRELDDLLLERNNRVPRTGAAKSCTVAPPLAAGTSAMLR